jgi:hypothetical protein
MTSDLAAFAKFQHGTRKNSTLLSACNLSMKIRKFLISSSVSYRLYGILYGNLAKKKLPGWAALSVFSQSISVSCDFLLA